MNVIRRLKNLRAKFCQVLWRQYAKLRRAQVDSSVVMNGRPMIRCVKGAQLILGINVRINTAIASNPVIGRSRSAFCSIAPGSKLVLEEEVGASGVCIIAAKEVIIGAKTILGADVLIIDTDFHLPDGMGGWNNAAVETAAPVRIGKGCFIGTRAVILKGVTIGDGAVVAAGAIVTKDVPSQYLAAGNPAVSIPLKKRWLQTSSPSRL